MWQGSTVEYRVIKFVEHFVSPRPNTDWIFSYNRYNVYKKILRIQTNPGFDSRLSEADNKHILDCLNRDEFTMYTYSCAMSKLKSDLRLALSLLHLSIKAQSNTKVPYARVETGKNRQVPNIEASLRQSGGNRP